jgi:hypothetical protein
MGVWVVLVINLGVLKVFWWVIMVLVWSWLRIGWLVVVVRMRIVAKRIVKGWVRMKELTLINRWFTYRLAGTDDSSLAGNEDYAAEV